jgi:hypothetical protein
MAMRPDQAAIGTGERRDAWSTIQEAVHDLDGVVDRDLDVWGVEVGAVSIDATARAGSGYPQMVPHGRRPCLQTGCRLIGSHLLTIVGHGGTGIAMNAAVLLLFKRKGRRTDPRVPSA